MQAKITIGKRAVGDQDVFAGLGQACAIHASAGFDAYGVVARTDDAMIDDNAVAGIDIEAVGSIIKRQIAKHDIGAIGGMVCPGPGMIAGKVFKSDIVAGDGLKK